METRWGNPTEIILDKANSWQADLIVVGTHGRGKLARAVLGSVSMKLIREAPCSLRHAGLFVSSVIEEGDPKEALIEAARNWNADMIFVARAVWAESTVFS
jgi:nucleotide-binding universal stress UspA family protein